MKQLSFDNHDYQKIGKAKHFSNTNHYRKGTERENCDLCKYSFTTPHNVYFKCVLKVNAVGMSTSGSDVNRKKVCNLFEKRSES